MLVNVISSTMQLLDPSKQTIEYIESCLYWCKQNGLRVILDLHKMPGFAFDELDKATLFESPILQERFINLWIAIARRFAGHMN